MVSEAERMARAGEYVLGRMTGPERERAERDLENDAHFRAAVLSVAERMRYFGSGRGDPARSAAAEAMWGALARRLAALPHMQAALPDALSHSSQLLLAGGTGPAAGGQSSGGLAAELRAGISAMIRALRRMLRKSVRRRKPPLALAFLETGGREVAATVEVMADGRLRLLLVKEMALAIDERLGVWGLRDDGGADRLAGFRPGAELRLKRPPGPARYEGFALARERAAPMPPSRMPPPLAQGRAKPLPGMSGARRADKAAESGAGALIVR